MIWSFSLPSWQLCLCCMVSCWSCLVLFRSDQTIKAGISSFIYPSPLHHQALELQAIGLSQPGLPSSSSPRLRRSTPTKTSLPRPSATTSVHLPQPNKLSDRWAAYSQPMGSSESWYHLRQSLGPGSCVG